jgi:hypothetical protein
VGLFGDWKCTIAKRKGLGKGSRRVKKFAKHQKRRNKEGKNEKEGGKKTETEREGERERQRERDRPLWQHEAQPKTKGTTLNSY